MTHYSTCGTCGHPNVHVDGNGLLATHFHEHRKCPGSGKDKVAYRMSPIMCGGKLHRREIADSVVLGDDYENRRDAAVARHTRTMEPM